MSLKSTFARNARAVAKRPSIGQGTAVTRARLNGAVGCEIEDGAWRLRMDLSKKSGGDGAAPDPGVYGRSALASCLVGSYALWAAKRGVEIDEIAVEIQADYDARGMYGVDGVIADYTAIRYTVAISSPAPDEEIEALARDAEKHCNYLNLFRRPHEMRGELKIIERSA
ncbi:MAG: OsmC family protein [Planctomycetota bacterium]|jgi:uncharacterized OsmC-like protein